MAAAVATQSKKRRMSGPRGAVTGRGDATGADSMAERRESRWRMKTPVGYAPAVFLPHRITRSAPRSGAKLPATLVATALLCAQVGAQYLVTRSSAPHPAGTY